MGYDFPDADDLALRLYERAALQSPVYYYELATLMLRMEAEGRETSSVMVGPVTGVSQAVGYLEKAAELNNVRAIRKLAEMLETGVKGVIVQDAKRALRLYRKLLSLVSSPADSSSSSSSEKNKNKHKINNNQDEKSVWAAFFDVAKIQFKITTLSAKVGLESVIKGGSGAEEEGVPGGREWDPVMDSAREGL
jgi:TPR repeat protein